MADFKDPYTPEKITLAILLTYTLVIPINQRQYAWGSETDVLTFLEDAVDSMISGYKYAIGDFITYQENGVTRVFDGQSRGITCVLFLTACVHHIADFSTSPEEKALIPYIQKLIFIDHDPWSTVSKEIAETKKKNKWQNYPRVKSYYKNDFTEIGNIMNRTDSNIDSKLYNAYLVCRKFIRDMKVGLKEFTGFLLNHTTGIEKRAATSEQAAVLMDRANNRGQRMQSYENMRNLFITCFHEKQDAMSEQIERLNKQCPHAWSMASLLFNKQIIIPPKKYVDETVKKVVKKEKEGIEQFLAYAESCAAIYKKLENTYIARRFGDLTWNVIAPLHVFQKKTEIDCELLYSIGIRQLQRGCLDSNSIGSRNPWVSAANATIAEEKPWILPPADPNAFNMLLPHIETVKSMNRNTTGLILWLAYRKYQPHGACTIQENLDIEHISGKQCSDGVTKKEYLGNLTFFEGPNDPLVKAFRGNRSLGKLPYATKREMYHKSAVKITNMVATEYESFGDEVIQSRGHKLLRELLA